MVSIPEFKNKKQIVAITCVCGWGFEIDLEKISSKELRSEVPLAIIEKHLKEKHNAESTTAMRRKPLIVN